MQPRLMRSRTEVIIAGVCGGLAEYFAIDPVIVRLIFVLVTLTSGIGLLVYPILWMVMPRAGAAASGAQLFPHDAEEWRRRAQAFGEEASQVGQQFSREVREVLRHGQSASSSQSRSAAPPHYADAPPPPDAYNFDPQTGLPVTPGAGAKPGPPLYLLEASAAATKPRLQVEAFNIGTYLNSFSTTSGKGTDEQVRGRLSEIERLTLETVKEYETISRTMSPTAKPLHSPSIRFHPGANLMIVIGEPEVVAVAGKVIGALPGARRSAGSDAPASGDGDPSQRIDEMIKKMQREGALRPPRP